MECDLIVGNLSDDDVLLKIVERKTQSSFAYKLPNKKVSSVMKAFYDFKNLFGENFDKVFLTITTVGGSEFSSLADLEKYQKFAHPYSSWEKGVSKNSMDFFANLFRMGNPFVIFPPNTFQMVSLGKFFTA